MRHELAFGRQSAQRLAFPLGLVAGDVLEHAGLKDEEGAVDPLVRVDRLFPECGDPVAGEGKAAEARRRMHGGQSRQPAMRAMEVAQSRQVNVGEAVAPRQHEGAIEVGRQPLDPAAGHGLQPGVDQLDRPVRLGLWPHHHLHAIADGVGIKLLDEVLPDRIRVVPERNDEPGITVMLVVLQQVPQDRLIADAYHRLGLGARLLGEPGALAAGKDGDFHAGSPRPERCSREQVASPCSKAAGTPGTAPRTTVSG